MEWQKFHASDAIVYALKETVNNVRIAIYSVLIFLCEMLVSIIVIGAPTLVFALWKMPDLRNTAIQIRSALFSGAYGSISAIIKDSQPLQIPLSVLIFGVLALCALLVLWSMFAAGYIRLIIKFHDAGSVELRELFMGWHRGPRLLLGGIIFGFSVTVGFLLLVIPGFYLLIHGILFPYFIVDKNVGIVDAFKRSFQAVRGYGWQIAALIAVGSFMNISPMILIFSGFIKLLMYVHAYRRLTA